MGVFNRGRVSAWEDEKLLETDSGDGCISVWMYFMPLNPTLKNGDTGTHYVIYIYSQ